MRDPTHPDAKAVLDSYMAAFEHSDAKALEPAAIAYHRGDDGRHHPFGLALLVVRDDRIARISVFHGAGIVTRFEGLA